MTSCANEMGRMKKRIEGDEGVKLFWTNLDIMRTEILFTGDIYVVTITFLYNRNTYVGYIIICVTRHMCD